MRQIAWPGLHRSLPWVERDRSARHEPEEGFGIVEVMVTLGVVFLALTALVATTVVTFRDVGLARQRQTANGLANETMEHARAMPLSDMQRGLNSASSNAAFHNDPNIKACPNGEYRFRDCDTGERLVSTTASTAGAPLVPHEVTLDLDGSPSTFTRRIYVTEAAEDVVPESGGYRIVVTVSWADTMQRGAPTVQDGNRVHVVEVQAIRYDPVGCVDPVLNPFSAPCSPLFSASGQIEPGYIQIQGAGGTPLLSLGLPGVRSQMQIEQVAEVETSAHGSGAFSGDGSVSGVSISARADDDPTTSTPAYDPQQMTNAASTQTAQTLLGTTATVSASNDIETLRATSAAGATVTNVCPTLPLAPARTDGLPCAHGHVTVPASRALTAQVGFQAAGINLFQTTLVNVTSPSARSSYQRIDQVAQPGSDGRTTLTGVRQLGRVELLRLPPSLQGTYGLLNPRWEGYLVALDNYSDQVTVGAGTGTSAPASGTQSGTLRVWNAGTRDYDVLPLGSPIAPLAIPTLNVSGAILLGPLLQVELGGQIEAAGGTTASQEPAGAVGTATRTVAEAGVNSPLRATLTIKISSGSTVLDLSVVVDLGSHTGRAIYKAAPGG